MRPQSTMGKKLKKILPIIIAGLLGYLIFIYLIPSQRKKSSEHNTSKHALNLNIPNPVARKIEENKIKLYQRNTFSSSLNFDNDSSTGHVVQPIETDRRAQIEQSYIDSLEKEIAHNEKTRIDKQKPHPFNSARGKINNIKMDKKTVTQNMHTSLDSATQKDTRFVRNKDQIPKKKKMFSSFVLPEENIKNKSKKITLNQCNTTVIEMQYLKKIGEQVRVILTQDAKIGNKVLTKGKILFANTIPRDGGIGFTLKIFTTENGVQKTNTLIGYSTDERNFFKIHRNHNPSTALNEDTKTISKSVIQETILNDIPLSSLNLLKRKKNVNNILIAQGLIIQFKK